MSFLVVGLTGQTGAGKSTVSRIWAGQGIPVIDCDRLAREAVAPGTRCLAQLAEAFGREIICPDGTLDRSRTAAIAFSDPEKLAQLNRITHKAILDLLEKEIQLVKEAGNKLVVVDAPTLFESGADRMCRQVVSVIAPAQLRYERIVARDNLDEAAARRRMSAQKDDGYYTSRSQYVLVNDGTPAQLAEKAAGLGKILMEKAGMAPWDLEGKNV